ncbi:hypothetical protein ABT124_07705 [Streptomyces sp. NPDC001982]|uniref:hypothetical protein n=1 Tax=unclassified Streptomyces TaxID=2593676 RepID=UPI003316B47A
MRITVLAVPDCPNAPVIEERIVRALDGRGADMETVEVANQEQAARLGMTGSPTVLIDGVDPFAVAGAPASVSCRLYRGPDGRAEGAPSVADLQRALNFFTSGRSARVWAGRHPDHTGRSVDQARAEILGRSVFGSLLAAADADKA